jgi:sulfate transport system permease protein
MAADRRILPGFGLSLSVTLLYLGTLVAVPLAACIVRAASLSPAQFLAAAWTERARSAYLLTFGASLAAGIINLFVGLLLAWVLARYEFPLKRLFDALVDLPLALPTAVAGLVFSNLYVANGWLGQFLVPLGIDIVYTQMGVVLILVFVSLPFVVRTVQPVLESQEAELEEAAEALGATRWQTFWRVLLPPLLPALTTGFALAFARCLGEYGSVVFISGNLPNRTEIAPVLVVVKLEEFAYAEATAVAVVLLAVSFGMLGVVNLLELWARRAGGGK